MGLLFLFVLTIYIASAFLISERIAGIIPCREVTSAVLSRQIQNISDSIKSSIASTTAGSGAKSNSDTAKGGMGPVKHSRLPFGVSPLIRQAVHGVVFICFILAPVGIAYVFLWKPIRELPTVTGETWNDFNSEKTGKRNSAAACIARSMLRLKSCPLEDRKRLEECLRKSADRKSCILSILESRKMAAESKAIEIAKMAGITIAVSRSSIGDGLAMFFWKSKLVYETFQIYGFRPRTKTMVSIWAHVVFASFFAASVEELCNLLDVSDLIGGLPTRFLQGCVGMAVVLRSGFLARAYLTKGISAGSRTAALQEFRSASGLTSAIRETFESAFVKKATGETA